jgi:hypothetical protein
MVLVRIMMENQTFVWVRRDPKNYKTAKYRLADVNQIDWDNVSGGVGGRAGQWFLYGHVQCDQMVEGDLAHSGTHGDCPHEIKICILKTDNDSATYKRLMEITGPRPPREPTCAEDTVAIVRDKQPIRGPDLRKELKWKGHGRLTIDGVLPRLVKQKKLTARRAGRALEYRLPE